MEELVEILSQELEAYKEFIPISKEKTKAIVRNDIKDIQTITDKEQEFLDRINRLEKKREETIYNMANVTGKKAEELKISTIIKMLDKNPEEQKKLSEIYDNLKNTTKTLVDINKHNTSLIEQSLDMIEFNMNFIQSTWMSPGSSNYDRAAQADAEAYKGIFDAKQ